MCKDMTRGPGEDVQHDNWNTSTDDWRKDDVMSAMDAFKELGEDERDTFAALFRRVADEVRGGGPRMVCSMLRAFKDMSNEQMVGCITLYEKAQAEAQVAAAKEKRPVKEAASGGGADGEPADQERDVLLNELRNHIQSHSNCQLFLSMVGIGLSQTSRDYMKRQNVGLKNFLVRHQAEFRVEGPKGQEKVSWQPAADNAAAVPPGKANDQDASVGLLGGGMPAVAGAGGTGRTGGEPTLASGAMLPQDRWQQESRWPGDSCAYPVNEENDNWWTPMNSSPYWRKKDPQYEETGSKVYIGNLPRNVRGKDVSSLLSKYGHIEDVHVMRAQSKTGQSCAMVVYADRRESDRCIADMAAYEMRKGEGNLIVKYADNQRLKGKGKGQRGHGKGKGKSYR